jgi:serine/threonine-protein kinase PknK
MTGQSAARPAALPHELTTFVDRREQLVEARRRLGSTRLLTIVGPGGVGKTRFAMRVAHAVRKLYAENVWFFDLSAVVSGGSVADHVATILNAQGVGHDQAGELAAFFGLGRGILILDGCEHVLESVIDLVRNLHEGCPELSIVATSQSMLRLSFEAVLLLDPLSIPGEGVAVEASAVQLFLDRAKQLAAEPSRDELAEITEICRRLDGIPLAIELAATRIRALTPAQILERLDAPLTFLTSGYRDLPDRQRTLTATIAWSYELCTEDERELWRLMSVFVGEWDLASAERMLATEPGSQRVVDTVESLLERSIIRRHESGGTITYAMFDTVRLFGLQVSSASDFERASTNHRDWYLERLAALEADWYGPNQLEWLRLARRELPNIRSAIEFSIQRSEVTPAAILVVAAWRVTWQANGRFDELGRWAYRILALPSPRTAERCQLLALYACVEAAQGDVEGALARLDDTQRIAERLGDPVTLSLIESARGYADPELANKLVAYERALEFQRGENRVIARIDLEERLANVHDLLGHAETAAAMRAVLVHKATRAGEKHETSNLLMNAGIAATMRGDWETGTSFLRQALGLKRDLDSPIGLAQVEEALAIAASVGDDYERAAMLLGSARAIWDAIGAGVSAFSPLTDRRLEEEERARRVLGAHTFDLAYGRGQELPIADGVAFGLGLVRRTAPNSKVVPSQETLTVREKQIVALVGKGLSDREIAQKLVISKRTAEGHVSKSLMKLGLNSRSQLAIWVARTGEDG